MSDRQGHAVSVVALRRLLVERPMVFDTMKIYSCLNAILFQILKYEILQYYPDSTRNIDIVTLCQKSGQYKSYVNQRSRKYSAVWELQSLQFGVATAEWSSAGSEQFRVSSSNPARSW